MNLITTYYNNHHLLQRFIESNYSPLKKVFSSLKLIVVDDGSNYEPAYEILVDYKDSDIRLYKVVDDLGFNSHGARNLAMKETDAEWNILLDLDVVIGDEFISNLHQMITNDKLNKDTAYYFDVINTVRGFKVSSLRMINHLLIHRDLFWSVNGYDEEYRGFYHGDGEFIESLGKVGNVQLAFNLPIDIEDSTNIKPPLLNHRNKFVSIEKLVRQRLDDKKFELRQPIKFDWIRQL